MHHSPSGAEAEINQLLMQRFAALGVEVWCVACRRRHRADNIIAKIPGKSPDRAMSNDKPLRAYAITAHKDEIGTIVKTLGDEGRVKVSKLGGSFPWVYGEGVVDLLGDNETISGILSFGSRHVSHESPQKVQQEDTTVKWENAWIETKLTSAELETAGIRPGTRRSIDDRRIIKKSLKTSGSIVNAHHDEFVQCVNPISVLLGNKRSPALNSELSPLVFCHCKQYQDYVAFLPNFGENLQKF
nr:hypothetical protein [Nostoc sp. CHAB 5715]